MDPNQATTLLSVACWAAEASALLPENSHRRYISSYTQSILPLQAKKLSYITIFTKLNLWGTLLSFFSEKTQFFRSLCNSPFILRNNWVLADFCKIFKFSAKTAIYRRIFQILRLKLSFDGEFPRISADLAISMYIKHYWRKIGLWVESRQPMFGCLGSIW